MNAKTISKDYERFMRKSNRHLEDAENARNDASVIKHLMKAVKVYDRCNGELVAMVTAQNQTIDEQALEVEALTARLTAIDRVLEELEIEGLMKTVDGATRQ